MIQNPVHEGDFQCISDFFEERIALICPHMVIMLCMSKYWHRRAVFVHALAVYLRTLQQNVCEHAVHLSATCHQVFLLE